MQAGALSGGHQAHNINEGPKAGTWGRPRLHLGPSGDHCLGGDAGAGCRLGGIQAIWSARHFPISCLCTRSQSK